MYAPSAIPTEPHELPGFLAEELGKIQAAFTLALCRNVEFLNVVPKKLREGMVCGADGTNWNPGSGKGVYVYYSSAWHLLG